MDCVDDARRRNLYIGGGGLRAVDIFERHGLRQGRRMDIDRYRYLVDIKIGVD